MTIARDDELGAAFKCGLDIFIVIGVFSDRFNSKNPLDRLGDKRKGCDREIHLFVGDFDAFADFWVGQGTAYLG